MTRWRMYEDNVGGLFARAEPGVWLKIGDGKLIAGLAEHDLLSAQGPAFEGDEDDSRPEVQSACEASCGAVNGLREVATLEGWRVVAIPDRLRCGFSAAKALAALEGIAFYDIVSGVLLADHVVLDDDEHYEMLQDALAFGPEDIFDGTVDWHAGVAVVAPDGTILARRDGVGEASVPRWT